MASLAKPARDSGLRPGALSTLLLFTLLASLLLLGLKHFRASNQDTLVAEVLEGRDTIWTLDFDHDRDGRLEAILARIGMLSETPALQPEQTSELSELLFYLRAYYYFTPTRVVTEEDRQRVGAALQQFVTSPYFLAANSSEARENYLAALYLFLGRKVSAEDLAPHLAALQTLLSDSTPAQSPAETLELLRAVGFLAYEARNSDDYRSALKTQGDFISELLALGRSGATDWVLQHALWTLAYMAVLEEAEPSELDDTVWNLLQENSALDDVARKMLYSNFYLVNAFRVKDQCDDALQGRCMAATIDEALPLAHECSETLLIRATELAPRELTQTCERLTAQEAFFHTLLDTKHEPVADDLNTLLRVVIFDNYSEYNRHGQMLFNINTDNGGMYIEGEPAAPGNIATFYSFETFWRKAEFGVWNLNHEYVHYLDGRYIKYGGFGHYPEKLVWWSEGLAEYVANGDDNHTAMKTLKNAEAEALPDLSKIFSTAYGDGVELTYHWSYLAVRFLAEHDNPSLIQLGEALKQDQFNTYSELLSALAEQHDPAFQQWLLEQQEHFDIEPASGDKPRQIYRYLYRDYLWPETLAERVQRYHFG